MHTYKSGGVIIWSKFGLLRGYYLVQVISYCMWKHYKIGFSAHCFWKKIARNNLRGYYLVQVCVFWTHPTWTRQEPLLGPDNGPSKCFSWLFYLKMCWNTYFCSAFGTSTKIWQQNGPKRTITFHVLQNIGYWKSPLCCNPLFDQKNVCVCFNLSFFMKHWCWAKTDLKAGKN